ncbi:MAG: hypothetical protein UZ11_BCD004000884 [Bacteroidetes bacterium OLB11]|nr:MAG: hypothetical protein UZ11_BCD004000884 [Bacteroidetes bacterium OLB11]
MLPKIEKDISKKYLTNIESYNVSPYENIKDELELIKKIFK